MDMPEATPKMDMLDSMMAWESGELDTRETVELFSELVKNGMAWTLQGCYGRAATRMIESGVLDREGNMHMARLDEVIAASRR
jgi:hypothetical protein